MKTAIDYAVDEQKKEFKHGKETRYSESGRVYRVILNSFGRAHGPIRWFNEDGTIKRMSFKLNGETVTPEEMIEVLGEESLSEQDRVWLEKNKE